MRSILVVLLACLLLAPPSAMGQSGSAVPAVGDSTLLPQAAPVKKKKGGLFGKVKNLAKNKVVKTVAKAALCTAVPGGQIIAGALDGAETKDVAGAAASAATGGGSCMPGMGSLGGAAAGASGLGGVGTDALGAPVPTAALPGLPSAGMPAMTMSPEQMKQMQEQYAKMGMDPAQLQAMQQMMAGMPGGAPAAAPGPESPVPAAAPGTGAPALTREKGRIVVHQLPWVPGSDARQQGGELAFAMAIHNVALAMDPAGKRYKVEARVENLGGKAETKALARKRADAVVAALTREGIPGPRLSVVDGKADKDPRIIVSETK